MKLGKKIPEALVQAVRLALQKGGFEAGVEAVFEDFPLLPREDAETIVERVRKEQQ
jgi:hypothetical protein